MIQMLIQCLQIVFYNFKCFFCCFLVFLNIFSFIKLNHRISNLFFANFVFTELLVQCSYNTLTTWNALQLERTYDNIGWSFHAYSWDIAVLILRMKNGWFIKGSLGFTGWEDVYCSASASLIRTAQRWKDNRQNNVLFRDGSMLFINHKRGQRRWEGRHCLTHFVRFYSNLFIQLL